MCIATHYVYCNTLPCLANLHTLYCNTPWCPAIQSLSLLLCNTKPSCNTIPAHPNCLSCNTLPLLQYNFPATQTLLLQYNSNRQQPSSLAIHLLLQYKPGQPALPKPKSQYNPFYCNTIPSSLTPSGHNTIRVL